MATSTNFLCCLFFLLSFPWHLSSWKLSGQNSAFQHFTGRHRSSSMGILKEHFWRNRLYPACSQDLNQGMCMHMTSGNRKPYSTETSTLLVLLVRISKPLVQCWLWFVNSEHPGNALCLCYFRMMWLRLYFKQLLLRKELFTDHETAPKIIHTTASRQKGKQVE